MSIRKANRKSQILFPLVKMGAKHGDVPIHINLLWDYIGAKLYVQSNILYLAQLELNYFLATRFRLELLPFPEKKDADMLAMMRKYAYTVELQ